MQKRLKFVCFCGSIFVGATKTVGGWPSAEGLRLSDYIETGDGILERRAEPYGYFGTDCGAELRLDLLWNRILFW